MALNPFIFPPQLINTVSSRDAVLGWYTADVNAAIAIQVELESRLDAVREALVARYPDLAENLDILIREAEGHGGATANRQNADTLKRQFIAYLPYTIRKAPPAP